MGFVSLIYKQVMRVRCRRGEFITSIILGRQAMTFHPNGSAVHVSPRVDPTLAKDPGSSIGCCLLKPFSIRSSSTLESILL